MDWVRGQKKNSLEYQGFETYGVGVAVTVREIVDDHLEDLAGSGSQVAWKVGNLGHPVEPSESGDVCDHGDLGLQSRIGDLGGSSEDLASIVFGPPDLSSR